MPSRSRLLPATFAVVLLACLGCSREPDVQTYKVPKKSAVATNTGTIPPAGGGTQRILGAIIPAEPGYSIFIKFSGPSDVVTANEKAFDDFVAAAKLSDSKQSLQVTTPAGFRDAPPKQMRQATFQVGPAEKPVDLYVSIPFGGGLLENVNRWRKEVGAAPLTAADLKAAVPEVKIANGTAYRVDASGPGGTGGMGR